jgi:glycosyltransferase involved in cell wall biosynthesis
MELKLLVIMPLYNSEGTVENAIKSILNQSHKNLILTIVDDCSTDNSLLIAQQFLSDPRVSVYSLAKNMGAYAARNFGLFINQQSEWDYFTTHDADDVSFSFRYESLIAEFNNKVMGVQDMFERIDFYKNVSLGTSVTMAHAIFSREVFEKIGYFDSSTRFAADWEYWQRLKVFVKHNGMLLVTCREKMGQSFVHGKNLTVEIPIGSLPRLQYVEAATKKIEEIKTTKNYFYTFDFLLQDYRAIKTNTKIRKRKTDPRVAIVLLTWKRVHTLQNTLNELSEQTNKNFELYISNGNLEASSIIDKISRPFKDSMKITVLHQGNKDYSFRRLILGNELSKKGFEAIIFLDDDVSVPSTFVQECLSHYNPKSYMSWYAWKFDGSGDYFKRIRVRRPQDKVDYGGAGVSIIDASIFKHSNILKNVPKEAFQIEDLWTSYCVANTDGWSVKYLPLTGIVLGGSDSVALHKQVQSSGYTKTDFLNYLMNKGGWVITA